MRGGTSRGYDPIFGKYVKQTRYARHAASKMNKMTTLSSSRLCQGWHCCQRGAAATAGSIVVVHDCVDRSVAPLPVQLIDLLLCGVGGGRRTVVVHDGVPQPLEDVTVVVPIVDVAIPLLPGGDVLEPLVGVTQLHVL